MSIIPCTTDCIYQSEGCCSLERAGSRGRSEPGTQSCIHYVKKSRGSAHGASDRV